MIPPSARTPAALNPYQLNYCKSEPSDVLKWRSYRCERRSVNCEIVAAIRTSR
jgi:hypothetical protein